MNLRASSDRRSPRPKYVEIRRRILRDLQSGAFPSGAPLPKERDLAVSLNVARGTLRHALRELEREGLIRRVRGKGTFVNSTEQRRAHVRTNVVWLIVPDLRHDIYPALVEGAEQSAVAAGGRLMTSNSGNEVSRQEKLLRDAAQAEVAGVLLVPATQLVTPRLGAPEQIRPLRERRIPIVFCHRRIEGVAAPLVTWPFMDVGRLTADTLLSRGHRRIVSLAYTREVFVEAVALGFEHVMKQYDVDPAGYRVISHGGYQGFLRGEQAGGEFARAAIHRAVERLLARPNRPTAIQCFNSFDVEQVYLSARELGYRIPEDLSLVYFGAQRRIGPLSQRITCVGVDEGEIAVRACWLLEEMNSGLLPQEIDETIEIPPVLLPGETVAPPAESRREGETVSRCSGVGNLGAIRAKELDTSGCA